MKNKEIKEINNVRKLKQGKVTKPINEPLKKGLRRIYWKFINWFQLLGQTIKET